jgi:glucuronokinase
MKIIRNKAYARAGLLGTPSDGYNGKTISFIIRNYYAEIVLYEWNTLEIVPSIQDKGKFRSIHDLVADVRLHGYYGGMRLIKATIKRFADYCSERNIELHSQNFSIRYSSTIPRQVGMAGSSSIIVATLRCLMEFYDVHIPKKVQPSFVLSVEQEELGISGGLQDRVIQVYEGLVYMNFDKEAEHSADGFLCYDYQPLNPSLLPNIYIAYHAGLSEPTEVFHNNIRGRFMKGEPEVVHAMQRFAQLTEQGKQSLQDGDISRLANLINENFDLRQRISQLPEWQTEMIRIARSCGASAKFAGSGGAIVGTYTSESMLQELASRFEATQVKTFVPDILPSR